MNLKEAIELKSEEGLITNLKFNNKFTTESIELITEALRSKWHSQHEDLLGSIYLNELKDDRFVKPILDIASNQEKFRWYDDELESTLRKCVHVLIMINTPISLAAVEELRAMNNDNINIVLDMYRNE